MLMASTALLILCFLVGCDAPPADAGDADKGQTVPLEFAAGGGGGQMGQVFTRLDSKGEGSIPFATPAGKLVASKKLSEIPGQ